MISLICPLKEGNSQTLAALREMESFLKKWPLSFELIIVLEPPSQDRSWLQEAKTEEKNISLQKLKIRILENEKKLGRAASLEKGLRSAEGEWLLPFNLDFSIPLGELLSFIQEMQSPEALDLILGNRKTAKKKQERTKMNSWLLTLEKILLEKWRQHENSIVDPLCGYWALRKSAFEKIQNSLRLHRWHYSLDLLPLILAKDLKIRQIPLLSKDSKPSEIPLFREYLKNIFSPN